MLAMGVWWTSDEAARITSVVIANSIAYLPYLFAIWVARGVPETPQLRRVALTGAISFRLLGFAAPALLSDDVIRYEWEARMVNEGVNPYRTSPAAMAESDRRVPGYDFSAVYGPVLEIAHAAVYWAGLPLKASAAIAEGLMIWLLWRRGGPLWRWMLVGWCPLCVFEYWMNGHNDAWLLLTLYLALAAEGVASWAWLGLATLTKWWPLFLAPIWLRTGPSLGGVAVYGAMLAACLGLMPLGEWVTKVRFTTGFLGGWQNNAYLYRFLTDKMQAIGIVAVSSVAVPWLQLPRVDLVLALVTCLLAFSANLHPWYLGWLLPSLAFSRVNPLPWLLPMAILPLAYDPIFGWRLNGMWIEDPQTRNWIWSAITLFAGISIWRKRNG